MKWKPMKSAPTDGTPILLGLWVQHNQEPKPHWETYIAVYDSEAGEVYSIDYEGLPWEWSDFDMWCAMPKPPEERARE